MQPCFLKIVTVIDGEESIFSKEAEMELFPQSAKLRYFENGGRVSLCISDGQVAVEREGDYILRLLLKEGGRNRGIIGLPGAEGEVETITHKIGFAIKKNSLLMSMKYTLLFDSGKQEMHLRLVARSKKKFRRNNENPVFGTFVFQIDREYGNDDCHRPL